MANNGNSSGTVLVAFALGAIAGAAVALVAALPLTDELGFALAGAVVAAHWWRARRRAAAE